MKDFSYVPTVAGDKRSYTPTKCRKTNFRVEICEHGGRIGVASVVLTDGKQEYLNVVTKYEKTENGSSNYFGITEEELKNEHNEIIQACKELLKVWGY